MFTPSCPPPPPRPAGRSLRSLWETGGAWRPRALVAEDDAALRALIVRALRRAGFVVSEARDGLELMEIAAATVREEGAPPELVVTDVRMPGRSGVEALAALRGTLSGAAILVITAFADEEVRLAAQAGGAVGVLDKPFELAELTALAASLVR
ncbi:MAG: response regulator [Polyangiales bacterium]